MGSSCRGGHPERWACRDPCEVWILAGGVVGAALGGLLVALAAAPQAVPPSRIRAASAAVAVVAVAASADADKSPTTAAVELAMGIQGWPLRASWVMPPA